MDKDVDLISGCPGCKHDEWITAWQEKEKRKQQLFANVQANVITWACVGCLGYFLMILLDAVKQYLKN